MTIENPKKYIEGVMENDFSVEPERGFNEVLLQSPDGHREIWSRRLNADTDVIGWALDKECIIQIEASHPPNRVTDYVITVGVAPVDHLSTHVMYTLRKNSTGPIFRWVPVSVTGVSDDYDRSPAGFHVKRYMQDQQFKIDQGMLPLDELSNLPQVDIVATAGKFFEKTLYYLEHPDTFAAEPLKPELIGLI